MKKIINTVSLSIATSILTFSCSSQDLKGSEINVSHISGRAYTVNINFFDHIPTLVSRPFILLNWGDGSPIDTLTTTGTSACGDSYTSERTYSAIHTFPADGTYIISCIDSFRVDSIKNISGSINEKMYLRYQLIISPFFVGNNSPISSTCLIDTWQCCIWIYNSGSYDSDGDSLVYSLVAPIISIYTFPLASVDSITGDMTFNPTDTGFYAFSMRIDEWRNSGFGYFHVGTTFREMLVVVNTLTSINEYNFDNQINIYPNPTNGDFTIQFEKQIHNGNINIVNSIGEIILTKQLNFESGIHFDISNQPKGIYFVSVQYERGVSASKIIIE